MRNMRWSVAPFLLLMLVLGTGCKVDDASIISQAAQVHTGLQPAVITDPELSGYLQKCGDRIIQAAQAAYQQRQGPEATFDDEQSNAWMFKNMKFHFVNSKTVNAFTTGGEHMYIYTALFQNCQTEDELVAVMAHEFAHVYGRHVQKGTQRQYGIIAAAAAAGVVGAAVADKDKRLEGASLGAGLGAAGASFLGMGFTRKDEDEADKYGFLFYTRAGWDPNRFADFFQRMIDMGYDTTPEMLSDHPTLASRVEKTRERVANLPPQAASWRRPNVATPAEFEALKKRSVEIGARMPNDESLAKAQQLLSAFPSCVSAKDNAPEQVQARKEIAASLQNQKQQKK